MTEPEHWYVERDGRPTGPFTIEQLRTGIVRGELRAADRVRPPGSTTWTTASKVPQLVAAASSFVRGTANEPVTTVMSDRADEGATSVMTGPSDDGATVVMAGPADEGSTSVRMGLADQSAPGLLAHTAAAAPSVKISVDATMQLPVSPATTPARQKNSRLSTTILLLLVALVVGVAVGALAGHLWGQRNRQRPVSSSQSG